MSFSIWSFQDRVTPWIVAARSGRLSESDVPLCPHCGAPTQHTLRWLFCAGCRFAGDAVRYAVAVEFTIEDYHTVLREVAGEHCTDRDALAVFTHARNLYAFDVALRDLTATASNNGDVSPTTASARAFVGRMGINRDCQPGSVLVATPSQIEKLITVGETAYPDVKWSQCKLPQIIIPYWACPGVIHSIQFIDARRGGGSRIVELNKTYRIGFTGIADYQLNSRGLYITDTAYDAFVRNTHSAQFEKDKFAVAARRNSTHCVRTLAWLPGDVTVTTDSLRPSFVDVMTSVAAGDVEVGVEVSGKVIKWLDYLPGALLAVLLATPDVGSLTAEEADRLTAARLSDPTLRWLFAELCKFGQFRKAEAVKRHASDRVVCEMAPSGHIRISDGRYTLERSNGELQSISNFVVRPVVVTFFAELSSMSVGVDIECADHAGHVQVPMDAFHSVPSFEKYAATVVLKQVGLNNSPPEFPVVFTRKPMLYLLAHLLTEVATLPRREGISRYGWDVDRRAFYTALGKYDTTGLNTAVTLAHDKCSLRGVMSPASAVVADPTCPDGAWMSLMSIMASVICRAFWQMPQRAISISPTAEAQRVLEQFFRNLGQRRAVTMHVRSDDVTKDELLNAAHGYPLLVVNSSTAEHAQIPGHVVIASASGGLYIPELLDAGRASAIWAFALSKITHGLLTGAINESCVTHGVDSTRAAVREGRKMLREATGWNLGDAAEYGTPLDTWFSNVPEGRVTDIAALHLVEQEVVFTTTGLPPEDVEDIRVFASAQAPKSYRTTEHGFAVDAIAAMNMLTTFYGRVPTMRQVTNEGKLQQAIAIDGSHVTSTNTQ